MLDHMSNNFSGDIQGDGGKTEKKGIARSEIAFPYVSLEDAVAVTRAIYDNGAALSRDQIAGFLRLKSAHLRILAAKLFGLIIEMPDGKLALADLGVSILSNDEGEARAARRDAFLKVPLYNKAYETFKNRNLPARPFGLENAFVEFGVAPKQKDKARLAFERSAGFAGYFEANKDRLVEPIIAKNPILVVAKQWKDENSQPEPKIEPDKIDMPSSPANEFLIKGLLDRLPPTGKPWGVDERARWLRALSVNLEMIYGDGKDIREIEIKVQSHSETILKTVAEKGLLPELSAKRPSDLDDETPF